MDVVMLVRAQGTRGTSKGIPLWPPSRILNNSPSQARFNPNERNIRLMRAIILESVTHAHWDWTFVTLVVMQRLQHVHIPLIAFLGKVSPSPLNVCALKPLAYFRYGCGGSASICFLN
jgi:hypothetical protein